MCCGENGIVPKHRLLLVLLVVLVAVSAAPLFAATPGPTLPRALAGFFFGPNMVRAEVVMQERGGVRAYRLDQGRIRAIGRDTITLLESDGTVVVIPFTSSTEILVNGRRVNQRALQRGMRAVVVRVSGGPAETIRATR
jgi:hypothetical protein